MIDSSTPHPGEAAAVAKRPLVGVLAVQGDVSEHVAALEAVGARVRRVKRPGDLDGVAGLILPGGESTALRRLLDYEGLLERVREKYAEGMPVFGTCAGAILLATEVKGAPAPHLSLLPMTVRRNAFGRQRESFVAELDVKGLEGGPLTAVFIRAPVIEAVGPGMQVLGTIDGEIVLAESGQALVASFHPELTPDPRLHRRFIGKIGERSLMLLNSPSSKTSSG
ncbi:MAG TPA: pyridoxal 5'-phosphate synthase glutaminase subunit PdxT [Gemmatimonadota bacterium]|nr:pyridoxal 5'-phosphate synthase glutaminase subunit PdxT [Gemmatimonadota bacterium]